MAALIGRFFKVGDYSSYCRCVESKRLSNGKKKGENNKARAELEKALRLDENFMGADEARRVLAEL